MTKQFRVLVVQDAVGSACHGATSQPRNSGCRTNCCRRCSRSTGAGVRITGNNRTGTPPRASVRKSRSAGTATEVRMKNPPEAAGSCHTRSSDTMAAPTGAGDRGRFQPSCPIINSVAPSHFPASCAGVGSLQSTLAEGLMGSKGKSLTNIGHQLRFNDLVTRMSCLGRGTGAGG
jgi:hypothetical protein